MGIFSKLADNKYYKALMPILYGWGAALVILGALFKINHYPGATLMLAIGMSVEALIFFMSAFEKAPKQYHWEKAYPNILEKPEDTQGPVQQLNNIFKEAEIDSKVLSKLGDGMKKLSTSASQMGDVMDGITNLIDDDGYYAFENHYIMEILDKLQYDTFYHEHLRTYSLLSLIKC